MANSHQGPFWRVDFEDDADGTAWQQAVRFLDSHPTIRTVDSTGGQDYLSIYYEAVAAAVPFSDLLTGGTDAPGSPGTGDGSSGPGAAQAA